MSNAFRDVFSVGESEYCKVGLSTKWEFELEDGGGVMVTSNVVGCANEDSHIGMPALRVWEQVEPPRGAPDEARRAGR